MKIGSMYRVKCPTNRQLDGKVGVLVAAHLDRMSLIPYTLMLDGKMLSFDKEELILIEDV